MAALVATLGTPPTDKLTRDNFIYGGRFWALASDGEEDSSKDDDAGMEIWADASSKYGWARKDVDINMSESSSRVAKRIEHRRQQRIAAMELRISPTQDGRRKNRGGLNKNSEKKTNEGGSATYSGINQTMLSTSPLFHVGAFGLYGKKELVLPLLIHPRTDALGANGETRNVGTAMDDCAVAEDSSSVQENLICTGCMDDALTGAAVTCEKELRNSTCVDDHHLVSTAISVSNVNVSGKELLEERSCPITTSRSHTPDISQEMAKGGTFSASPIHKIGGSVLMPRQDSEKKFFCEKITTNTC